MRPTSPAKPNTPAECCDAALFFAVAVPEAAVELEVEL